MIKHRSDKRFTFCLLLMALCLLVGLANSTLAQNTASYNTNNNNSASENLAQKANEYFQNQDWKNAIESYLQLAKQEPNNGRVWYRLGFSYHSSKNYEKAVEAFSKAVEIGNNPVFMYNLACAYSQLGNREESFKWLNKAVEQGFNQVDQIKNDTDLVALHTDGRFDELVKKADKLAYPCNYLDEARQFDFWVGTWDVKTQQGFLAGTNTIERVIGGCALIENWTSSQGGTGKSLNFYNSNTKKWYQNWIDDKGGVINFVGEFKDKEMRFQAEAVKVNGQSVLRRLTFFHISSDQVRQLGEISQDDGKTWAAEYDFNYFRRKEVSKK
ncbi:MAG: tetratricopeptide repeat protein [Blastocatellia bacterium]|nr:tetratricopeptide repeat protein [Blastocatellia bacterium]